MRVPVGADSAELGVQREAFYTAQHERDTRPEHGGMGAARASRARLEDVPVGTRVDQATRSQQNQQPQTPVQVL